MYFWLDDLMLNLPDCVVKRLYPLFGKARFVQYATYVVRPRVLKLLY